MILRQLLRRPVKSTFTALGIAFAVAILILPRFMTDSMRHMVDVSFNVAERNDLTVSFVEPQSLAAYYALRRVDGVLDAEPFRALPVRLAHGPREHRESVQGLVSVPRLSRPLDAELVPLVVPDHGVLLSEALAELLAAEPGDELVVQALEGRQPSMAVRVTGIAETFLGTPAYMRLESLARAMREGTRISGVHLTIDARRQDAIYRELKATPIVAGINLRSASGQAFEEMLDESVGTFTAVLVLFAALIACGVVYNSARIALSERRRELASLRVLGFTRGEAAYILLGELGALTLIALPFGAVLGILLCAYLVASFNTELYQIPFVVHPASVAWACLVIALASAVSGWLVARDVGRLDLVAALKTRE